MKLLIFCILLVSIFNSEPQTGYEIELLVNGAKSNNGVIRVLIFNKKDGFPEEPKKAIKALSLPVSNLSAKVIVENLPSGNYAISVFHDEDSDGKIRKNNLGLPLDSYGFSNNPALVFGPPSFSKSAVQLKNSTVKVEITLR